jgi:hypothetical protein
MLAWHFTAHAKVTPREAPFSRGDAPMRGRGCQLLTSALSEIAARLNTPTPGPIGRRDYRRQDLNDADESISAPSSAKN